ncbi:hypothetical protein ACFCV3_41575 [Kribbella sp. NPDC056345]|uniref:hypothetical protein n=1 Tax=Kribbella sp. NPDC056345 TaxID=3345789 RepID=UPI0035E26FE7
MIELIAAGISVVALVVSGLSWRATRQQAVEARRSRELMEEQHHQQSKPDIRVTFGDVPEQGWIPIEVWCPVPFDSAKLTLPREYHNGMFAGFGPGPVDPNRLEYSLTFDFPATAAGTTVSCGLWAFQPSEVVGHPFRLLCEIRSGGRPWIYTIEHTFPDIAAELNKAIWARRPGNQ